MSITLIDLVPRLHTPELRELLLFLVGWREEDEVNQRIADRAIEAYLSNPYLRILGVEQDKRLTGLIGLEFVAPQRALIRQIVVHPVSQRTGIGRAMIAAACEQFNLKELVAETDQDAVEFYQRCGFQIQSLGEKYPNTERFQCAWRRLF
jgi:ribosomal protein S18 acetylase RimI-like enzyme